jgi:hypothetical protein
MRIQLAALASFLALAAADTAARADADSLGDLLGPREVALGEGLRAGATGGLATTLNPAGLPLTHELVFEGSYGYRPDDHASLVGLSACDSTNVAPGCFYYHYADRSPDVDGMESSRRTHVAGATLSRQLGTRAIVGVDGKYFNFESDVMGEADKSGFTWDLGALVRLTDIVNLGAVGYNLFGNRSPEFPRAFAAGVYVRPTPQVALGFDALWNLDTDGKTGRYGGGAEYDVAGSDGKVGYPLRLGVVHDVATGTYVTGGLGVGGAKLALDVGARKQVSEGDELLVTASLRVFGPRQ